MLLWSLNLGFAGSTPAVADVSATSLVQASGQLQAATYDTAFPLELSVDNTGGVTGLTITASIRDVADSTSYLDFDDNTFKTSAWTSKTKTLTSFGSGFYGTTLDISAFTPPGDHLAVEYDISGAVTAVTSSILSLTGSNLAGEIIEGTLTHQETLRLILAATAGILSGAAGTTVTIRDTTDTTDRIVATVDASGNRTAVTLDPS